MHNNFLGLYEIFPENVLAYWRKLQIYNLGKVRLHLHSLMNTRKEIPLA